MGGKPAFDELDTVKFVERFKRASELLNELWSRV